MDKRRLQHKQCRIVFYNGMWCDWAVRVIMILMDNSCSSVNRVLSNVIMKDLNEINERY